MPCHFTKPTHINRPCPYKPWRLAALSFRWKESTGIRWAVKFSRQVAHLFVRLAKQSMVRDREWIVDVNRMGFIRFPYQYTRSNAFIVKMKKMCLCTRNDGKWRSWSKAPLILTLCTRQRLVTNLTPPPLYPGETTHDTHQTEDVWAPAPLRPLWRR